MENLNEVIASLRVSRRRRTAIARELQAHVEEAQRDLELTGLPAEEAQREALARLGDPAEIAEGFTRVHRTPRRVQVSLAFGLAGILGLGTLGLTGSLASARAVPPAHAAPVPTHVAKHSRP